MSNQAKGDQAKGDQAKGDQVHGEGNYEATRQYNEATKKFIDAGKVDQAAKNAAPKTKQEAVEMEQAEKEAKSHLKEDDPPAKEQAARKP